MSCNKPVTILEFVFVLLILSGPVSKAPAQTTERGALTESYFTKPVQLIDLPTASILRGGQLRSSLRLFEQGGLMGRLSVGLSNRMMFGLSYAALHVIGSGKVDWHQTPGVHFVYRLVEENLNLPALVLGFDSQGFGPVIYTESGESERYANKSRGFYAVVSKNYSSVVDVGLHAGANYSLEKGDHDPNIFMGTDLAVSRDVGLQIEYDFAINDDVRPDRESGKGFLNAGVRWAFSNNFYLQFDFKNLLDASSDEGIRRIFRVVYHGTVL